MQAAAGVSYDLVAADAWAAALCLCTFVFGRLPHSPALAPEALLARIAAGAPPLPPPAAADPAATAAVAAVASVASVASAATAGSFGPLDTPGAAAAVAAAAAAATTKLLGLLRAMLAGSPAARLPLAQVEAHQALAGLPDDDPPQPL